MPLPVSRRRRHGSTAVEYAMVAALVGLVIFTGVSLMGDSLVNLYDSVTTDVTTALGG